MNALPSEFAPQRGLLDYAALDRAEVRDDPFRHLVAPDFVPPDVLAKVYAELPRGGSGGSLPPEAVRMGPTARALMREIEGPELKRRLAAKFGLDLSGAPSMLTFRVATREQDGRIHTDSRTKLMTSLIYLNPPGEAFGHSEGCLRLLRGPDDLEDYVAEVPPVRGTLLVFQNGPTAWHGHHRHVGQRYSVQLNYMASGRLARSELRRHRVSAVLKRAAGFFTG